MSANIGMLILIGVLTSAGVYLLIERSITRMLLGLLLFGNAINLLILTVGGSDGNPPIVGRDSVHEEIADPLAQGMILTAIVITMGIAGFVLALAYRSY
jgi:multicomponent Na+:H+ antiporter subunit C